MRKRRAISATLFHVDEFYQVSYYDANDKFLHMAQYCFKYQARNAIKREIGLSAEQVNSSDKYELWSSVSLYDNKHRLRAC